MKRIIALLLTILTVQSATSNDEEMLDTKKLLHERNSLKQILLSHRQHLSKGSQADNYSFSQTKQMSDKELKKLEADIKAIALRCSREREAIDYVFQVLAPYGLQSIDKTFSNPKDIKDFQKATSLMNIQLDRLPLLDYLVKQLKENLAMKEAQVWECQNKMETLYVKLNKVDLSKKLNQELPNWKKTSKDLAELRDSLPKTRLSETVLEFKAFDKDGNHIIDSAELKGVEDVLTKRLESATQYGLLVFDKNRDKKLTHPERLLCNRVFDAIAVSRLADLNADGTTTKDEIRLLALTEAMHFNSLAERYAGTITVKAIPKPTHAEMHDYNSGYRIQSIQSANSLLIGRSNFVLPATLYGVALPSDNAQGESARLYLVNLLANTPYRIDHKTSASNTRRNLILMEKLSSIVISKVSFADTRISTVFEFLKNRARSLDPSGEGVNFQLYPEQKIVDPKRTEGDNKGRQSDHLFVEEPEKNEPLVTMDLDNSALADVILNVGQLTGSTIEIDNGMIFVRLPHAKPRKTQATLLELSLYLPAKGRTASYLLIRNGHAKCIFSKSDTPVKKELIEAQEKAKQEGLGIWKN